MFPASTKQYVHSTSVNFLVENDEKRFENEVSLWTATDLCRLVEGMATEEQVLMRT